MVVESLRTSHLTRGVPAFLTSAVSQNKNELTDPNYLENTVTPAPAAPQLSTVITTSTDSRLGLQEMKRSPIRQPVSPEVPVVRSHDEIGVPRGGQPNEGRVGEVD